LARLSVYVPDELLEQAKTLEDSENTSQLIQRGLQRLVEEQTRTPSYARRPRRSNEQIVEIRNRLLTEAREDYELGYALALEASSAMSLHVINALVAANFDLAKWLEPFKNGLRYELMEDKGLVEVTQENVNEVERALLDSIGAPPQSADQFKNNPWWWLWKTAEALGDIADPIGFDHYSFTPTTARQRGYVDALRELWSALENPVDEDEWLHQIGVDEDEYRRKKAAGELEGGDAPGSGDSYT